ncbi:MAG TPA: ribosomal protein S18-alanine N-acetyltransferase [Thermoanaerobaculia bacterium]|nr:ribosomal protein S18-alanine N-acetyltransferase [Thermoanaerobaculia bacterium]
MRDEVVIEAAARADLDAIQRIEEASFPAPWRREFFRAEIAADGRFAIVARLRGETVGYLFAMWILDEMHVNKIAVDERLRRQGIADRLMARCFEFAREHDVRTIALEVRLSNVGAQEFYRHLDFESSYLRPRYYPDGEAAVVMVRSLSLI